MSTKTRKKAKKLKDNLIAREFELSNQPANNEETVDEEVDGMGAVETYADYWPKKLKIGAKHPDPVCETGSLSSVESANITYELKLPNKVITDGLVSALQLEAVCYASQAHQRILLDNDRSRAGFLIGDGAGVGKGRTVAAIIYENWLNGRTKSLWISVSNDLKYDAERDLHDIMADNINVYALNKLKYNARISSVANRKIDAGVIFCTYATLIGKTRAKGKYNTRIAQLVDWCGKDFDGCIIFDECHKAKNLIPVNSLKPTQTGKAVLELQKLLPKARVVYSSATGASEPRNMAYMTRLGIWGVGTAFRTFQDFERTVERRGVGAMEIVAMDMKLRGMYVARQLSFHGVTFKVEKVPLTEDFISTYNDSVVLWNLALKSFQKACDLMSVTPNTSKIIFAQFWGSHQRFFKYLTIAAKVDHVVKLAHEAIAAGKCVVIGLQSTGEAKLVEELDKHNNELDDYVSTANAVFQSLVEKHFPALDPNYGAVDSETNTNNVPLKTRKRKIINYHLRFFPSKRARRISSGTASDDDIESSDKKYKFEFKNSLVSPFNEEMNRAKKYDSSRVKNISSSETFSSDSEFEDWRSRNKENIQPGTKSKVQQHLINQYKNSKLAQKSGQTNTIKDAALDEVFQMKEELLRKIKELGKRLPKNTLDDLINKLGGPDMVAEMTGRKGRVIGTKNENVRFESRTENGISFEMLNIKEKQRFMNGEKLIAVISEAASSGISLQSDRRVQNQRRRLHITLELPWAADRAIQQFGRTHRSNQVNAPEYMLLVSDLAGEQRFVSSVARRLERLGALTHADRRATQTRDLSEFNINTKYGRRALAKTAHAIRRAENPIVPPPENYVGDFFGDVHKALIEVGLDLYEMGNEDKKSDNIVRFLNRSLGIRVELQNYLFNYFSDTLNAIITKAKKENKYDLGILDIGKPEKVTRIDTKIFHCRQASSLAPIELHTLSVDRGMSWEEALEKFNTMSKAEEGFYVYHESKFGKRRTILAESITDDETLLPHRRMFKIYRPNTGVSLMTESLSSLQTLYVKTTIKTAEKHWLYQYDVSSHQCAHAFFSGKCKLSRFCKCEHGLRIQTKFVVTGSVLGVWDRLEKHLRSTEDESGRMYVRMQLIRMQSNDGHKAMGILIPKDNTENLIVELSRESENDDPNIIAV